MTIEERVARLVAEFNGMIKYTPMLQDNPKWSDAACLLFAKKWHAIAVENYKKNPVGWNNGIPYCRNVYRPEYE